MSATVILTYRDGATPERRRNLDAVLGWLAQRPLHPVIVVEQDAYPKLTAPLPHPACRTVFAYNTGPFNKGWGYNIAARLAGTPMLAFADADVIAGASFDAAVSACAARYDVAKPYRRLVDLTSDETARLCAGDYDHVPARPPGAAPDREGVLEVIVLCGGLFVIRAAAFARLGGWDERFRGWGGEDDAMTLKVQRARLSTVEFDERPAVHLHHTRPAAATHGQPHYRDNCLLVDRYRRYTEAELQRLAEVQRQVMGHREKYRPAASDIVQ